MLQVMFYGQFYPYARETVDMPSQEQVDKFLPAYKPLYKLDIENPISMGLLARP